MDGFLSADDCAALIALADGKLVPAHVVTEEATSEASALRTNSECNLMPSDAPEVEALIARLVPVVGLPASHAESLSILHYGPGEQFKPHVDGIWSGSSGDAIGMFERSGGQRLFTTMVYLNAVGGGGGTAFPKLRLRVPPAAGRLLVFANTPAGQPDQDPRAAHAGEAVTEGEKWVAVTWWRERPASGFCPA